MPSSPVITVDEEISQSRARLAICGISLVGFGVIVATQGIQQPSTLIEGFGTIVGYLLFGIIWHYIIVKHPRCYPRRRYVGMTADLGIMVFWMYLGDQYVTAYYPIFLWVIIGNGIRFGPRFLTVGLLMGAVGFGSLLVFDSYWRDHQGLGMGLLLGVVVLPVFFLTVLRRLQVVNRLEVELAKSRLADKAKDQFIATMSHELRTPMNGVLGMAELLKDSELSHDQREKVNVIARSVESLLNVISDILDFSKIRAGRLAIDSVQFDLKQVLTDVYVLLGPSAEDKGLSMYFKYPESNPRGFRGDPTRLRQIVLNLVGNAIKFTNEGRVVLECEVDVHGDQGSIKLQVADTGIGIPPERQAAIFDMFEQVDNSVSRQYGGAGLGLAISSQLTEMMGGQITLQSEVCKGSTFTVELKLPTCELAEQAAKPQQNELPNYGVHALVVEDNLFNQMVTRKMLTKLGVSTDVAENGAIAIDMLEKRTYDIVFMDIRMPVVDGYEATRFIRARDDALAEIPIVALTAEDGVKARDRCLAAGMTGYLAKPVRMDQIIVAIDECLAPTPTPVAAS